MEEGAITDGQISSSSQLDANHEASQGRLNLKGSWSAYANDAKQWLQIDLGSNPVTVTRVATQGSNLKSQWVINYTLKYSDHPRKFGNHVTVRPTVRPHHRETNVFSHFLASLGAQ